MSMLMKLIALAAAMVVLAAPLPPVPGADQLGVGFDVISGDFKVRRRAALVARTQPLRRSKRFFFFFFF